MTTPRKLGARERDNVAHLAALAVETGSEIVTTDRDFARFRGVRWLHPLDHAAT